jgi:hypothetical protein
MKDFFEKFVRSILVQSAKDLVNKVIKKKIEKKTPKGTEVVQKTKSHPWRQCPIGEHWVVTHPMKVPVSDKNPDGITSREGHCALNPKRNRKVIADYIEPDEIDYIAGKYFGSLSGPPTDNSMGFENGNEYDHLIRGWTKYWNDIYNPELPLDPNLVKALIGSESSFNPNPRPQNAGAAGKARGLIQLTDQAVKALSKPNNEIKDHYVKISKKDTTDPNMSIAAGVRWLFHKKRLASGKLGREATWEEAIAEYKAYTKKMLVGKQMEEEGMINIYKLYKSLQK